VLARRAYGYHSPESLIAMADLTSGAAGPVRESGQQVHRFRRCDFRWL